MIYDTVGQSSSMMVGQLDGWMVRRSDGQTVGWSDDRTVGLEVIKQQADNTKKKHYKEHNKELHQTIEELKRDTTLLSNSQISLPLH